MSALGDQPPGARAHVELLQALPDFGARCLGFDHVILALGGWACDRLAEGDEASVAAVLAWYESVLRDAPPDVCAEALKSVVWLLRQPRDVSHLLGPLTLERVTLPG